MTTPRPRFPLGRSWLAFGCLVFLLGMIAFPALTSASGFRTGLSINELDGERNGSLYVFGYSADIGGTVDRDVYAATIRLKMGGTVNGSVHVMSGSADISGTVHGSIQAIGGNIRIKGVVDGDVIVAGATVEITSSAQIRGDVLVASGNVTIDASVGQNVYGSSLFTDVNGSFSGNLNIQTGQLNVGNNTSIDGQLSYQAPVKVDAPNSVESSRIIRIQPNPWNVAGAGALTPFGPLARLVMSLITGAVLIAVAPRLLYRAAWHAEPMLLPAAVGLLAVIIGPAIVIGLAATMIGIPLALMTSTLLLMAAYCSQIVGGMALGRYAMPAKWRDGSRGYALMAMTIGVIVLGILRMAPLPFVGPIATILVTFWGIGGCVLLLVDVTARQTRAALSGRLAG